jgi:hypothetical protein
MQISYLPPKRQSHGHQLGRLSPTQILERSERFLGDHAFVHTPPLEFTVTWEPMSCPTVSAAVDTSPLILESEGDEHEGPFLDCKIRRRVSRKLPTASLRLAVEWLEVLEPQLKGHGGLTFALLYRPVWVR